MQAWSVSPPFVSSIFDKKYEASSIAIKSLGLRRLEQTQRAADVRRFHVPETCGDVDDSVVGVAERVDLDALRVC